MSAALISLDIEPRCMHAHEDAHIDPRLCIAYLAPAPVSSSTIS